MMSYYDYATGYAWGRNDQGANLNNNDIHEFGIAYQELQNQTDRMIPSILGFYEEFFEAKLRGHLEETFKKAWEIADKAGLKGHRTEDAMRVIVREIKRSNYGLTDNRTW